MSNSAVRAPLARGVRQLDHLSFDGNVQLVAVNSLNREVGYCEVPPGYDLAKSWAALLTLLDTVDPVPVEPRPMRLVRKPAPMSPSLSLSIARLATARVRVP